MLSVNGRPARSRRTQHPSIDTATPLRYEQSPDIRVAEARLHSATVQLRELQQQDAAVNCQLVQARYDGGAIDYTAVLDSQRSYLQARRDLVGNEGWLAARFITVNKALGNGPM